MDNSVARRFSDAAHRYDDMAKIQQLAAIEFDLWLTNLGLPAPDTIAEIGCGTGFFTQLLHQRFANADLCITDIAPQMLAMCEAKLPASVLHRFELFDGSKDCFSHRPDWVLSTMCFQWFTPLKPVLERHFSHSRVLAFSILLDGSFAPWQAAHQRLGLACGLQPLLGFSEVFDACQLSGARRVHAHAVSLADDHPDGLSFAASLRAIGADQPKDNHQPVNLRAVCRQLEHGLSANYEIGFFCIER